LENIYSKLDANGKKLEGHKPALEVTRGQKHKIMKKTERREIRAEIKLVQ
jgi:hypothetical protein